MKEVSNEDKTVGDATYEILLRRYLFAAGTLLNSRCCDVFELIPALFQFCVHRNRGIILHITHKTSCHFYLNDVNFLLRIKLTNIFRTYNDNEVKFTKFHQETPPHSLIRQPPFQRNQVVCN